MNKELPYACARGDRPTVQRLLSAGADPNEDDEGFPALVLAVKSGPLEMVEMLLEAGAHVDAQDPFGHTGLIAAIIMADSPMADLLLRHGADYKIATCNGRNALDLARAWKRVDIEERILVRQDQEQELE